MSNELTIKSIRETLSNYKIPDQHIEVLKFKAGNKPAKYIKWSYALGIFLKHYPEARWEFVSYEQADGTMIDVQYYKDGSCSVECNVWIGNIKMHMWLPVTKGQSMNPSGNSFDINTTKMRCLTKCISVCFGLGADVYGMDMLQEFNEGGAEVSSNESPIPKSSSVAKPPSSFTAEPDSKTTLDQSIEATAGYNIGKPYSEYNNDIQKVRKDLTYWKPKNNLNEKQQFHLNCLLALEKDIITMHEEAFKK